ncbi:hypothetical protein AWM75_08020 [Aerococcus urinaehominis]|uniref:Uncharacterized protein n=1 Tax=Aerococcus urinaehominis TaxID=128944 RepID=A0A0X8FM86_9LACT|nr:hypothetical protein [Aerococcus urinaehominis]AMB99917.1 hypothetical protein AWM75_08020 [Aerococcus urinaehominis]SDM43516.1 hypothetical protein SAMN04487985_11635 [Aerococcus urinaehominis]
MKPTTLKSCLVTSLMASNLMRQSFWGNDQVFHVSVQAGDFYLMQHTNFPNFPKAMVANFVWFEKY